jgi:hypothetical protein
MTVASHRDESEILRGESRVEVTYLACSLQGLGQQGVRRSARLGSLSSLGGGSRATIPRRPQNAMNTIFNLHISVLDKREMGSKPVFTAGLGHKIQLQIQITGLS